MPNLELEFAQDFLKDSRSFGDSPKKRENLSSILVVEKCSYFAEKLKKSLLWQPELKQMTNRVEAGLDNIKAGLRMRPDAPRYAFSEIYAAAEEVGSLLRQRPGQRRNRGPLDWASAHGRLEEDGRTWRTSTASWSSTFRGTAGEQAPNRPCASSWTTASGSLTWPGRGPAKRLTLTTLPRMCWRRLAAPGKPDAHSTPPTRPDEMPPEIRLLPKPFLSPTRTPHRPRLAQPVLRQEWGGLIDAWSEDSSLPLFIRKWRDNRGSTVKHLATGRLLVPCDSSCELGRRPRPLRCGDRH